MKTKINYLLKKGLSKKTLFEMTNIDINILFETFKKSEEKEAVQTTQQSGYKTTITPGTQANLNVGGTDISIDPSKGITMVSSSKPVGTGEVKEVEVKEKFESKAQQGLFWARCNECSSKNCKWCKMAKEFSDSTSKNQYKNMPEKKHPEKTVKYDKKETNENLQKFIEKTIVEILENEVDAKMTKKDLIDSIKKTKKKNNSFIIRKPKKVTMFSDEAPMELPIGQLFSIGKSKK